MESVALGGIYKHFKGGIYQVMTAGTCAETLKSKVVYLNQETGKVWVRDYDEFVGQKEIDGEMVERFEFLGMADVSQFLLDNEGE